MSTNQFKVTALFSIPKAKLRLKTDTGSSGRHNSRQDMENFKEHLNNLKEPERQENRMSLSPTLPSLFQQYSKLI